MSNCSHYRANNLTAEDFARAEREAAARGDQTFARLANRAAIGNLLPYAKQCVANYLNASCKDHCRE